MKPYVEPCGTGAMCPIIIQYIFYHHQNTVLINVHSLLFLGNIDHLYNKTGVLEGHQ